MCLFPAVLNGRTVIDCAPLDGVLKSPVGNGTWVECLEFDAADDDLDVEAVPAVVWVTIGGDPCVMPGRLGDRQIFDCVDFDGVFSCEFRPGQWKECSSEVKLRYTTSGAPCVFPFTYQGIQHNDCVQTEPTQGICQIANGDFEECAPPVFEETFETMLPPERTTALVDAVLSRR